MWGGRDDREEDLVLVAWCFVLRDWLGSEFGTVEL